MLTSPFTGPYMPKSDVGKRAWMEQFVMTIERHPDRYEMDEQLLAHLKAVVGRYFDALRKAKEPVSRTRPAVRGKNDARREAVALCRSLAMQFKADPTISDADKIALGIHVEDGNLTPVSPPRMAPDLIVLGATNGGHTIRWHTGPERGVKGRAKPEGVSHLLLFAAIGDRPLSVQHARLIGAYTKQPFEVNYPCGSNVEGKTATYYGRWLTGRGHMGPMSAGTSMIIAAARAKSNVPFAHIFGLEEVVKGEANEGEGQAELRVAA